MSVFAILSVTLSRRLFPCAAQASKMTVAEIKMELESYGLPNLGLRQVVYKRLQVGSPPALSLLYPTSAGFGFSCFCARNPAAPVSTWVTQGSDTTTLPQPCHEDACTVHVPPPWLRTRASCQSASQLTSRSFTSPRC